jgi:hypothetical protein
VPKPPPEQKLTGAALFQDRLLRLLEQEKSPADIRAALLADTDLAPFHDYIRAMEDRMIEVAVELAGKWGTKGTPS